MTAKGVGCFLHTDIQNLRAIGAGVRGMPKRLGRKLADRIETPRTGDTWLAAILTLATLDGQHSMIVASQPLLGDLSHRLYRALTR